MFTSKKTFESIDRGKILDMLEVYGIPFTIINAIALFYEHTESIIIAIDRETIFINIANGLLQGDTLYTNTLFIIPLDYVMRQVILENDYNFGFKII